MSSRVTYPVRKIIQFPGHQFPGQSMVVFLGSLLAVGLGYVVTTRPYVALTLLIGGLAFVSPTWLPLSAAVVSQRVIPGPLSDITGELTAADLLLLVVVLKWFARIVVDPSRVEGLFRGPQGWLIAFFAWAWVSLLVTDSWEATGLALGRVSLYGVIFIALSMERWDPSSLFRFVAYFAALEALLALLGLTPSEGLRAQGLYGDPGIFGFLMLGGLASSVVLSGYSRVVVTLLVLAGAALSFTRGIWVAALFGLALIVVPALTRRSTRITFVAGVILTVSVLSLPTLTEALGLNPQSASLRYQSWQSAGELIVEHPVVGLGWAGGASGWGVTGESEAAEAPPQPYNLWLNTAAATGVVGSLLLAAWLGSSFLELRGARRRPARAGLIYLAEIAVFSLAAMILFAGSSSALEFFILLGAGFAGLRQTPDPRWDHTGGLMPEEGGLGAVKA